MRTRSGPLLSVPYPMELNDAGTLGLRDHTGRQFADMIVDQFDEMLRSSEESPQVMSVITHSFISGQPFRLRALRRALDHIMKSAGSIWFTNPGAIASYFATLPSDE